jgi:hypothetical protein
MLVKRGKKNYWEIFNKDGVVVSSEEIDVNDPRVHAQQRLATSHAGHFRDDKQKMKSAEAVASRVQQLAVDMTALPKVPEFETISDERFMEIMAHPESWADLGFHPAGEYLEKLRAANVRKRYPGEVGYIEKNGKVTFYRLEDGFGKGVPVSNEAPAASAPGTQAYLVVAPDVYNGGTPTRAVIRCVDDDDALEYATELNASSGPDRAAQFDGCATHVLRPSEDGEILCVTCGATSRVAKTTDGEVANG